MEVALQVDDFLGTWLEELAEELAAGIVADASPEVRADQLAEVLSRSLSERMVLCDLFGAQGGVLEHNVSVEVVKRHKRSTHAKPRDHARARTPPPPRARRRCSDVLHDEPGLGVLHLDLRDALRTSFTVALVGVLPR